MDGSIDKKIEKTISNIDIYKDERVDNIGFGDMLLIQKPEEFCFGVDAVLLGDFAASNEKRNRESVGFDLGSGTGIVPLVASHKLPLSKIAGVEIQKESYERMLRNIKLNSLDDRISGICGNVKEIANKNFGTADFVTSNPPYMENLGSLQSENDAKAIARHEIHGKLEDFLKIGSKLLKDSGRFYLVHRPSRLVDIFAIGRKYRLEAKEIKMVAPKEGEAPNIVLVKFVKNGGHELKIQKQLNVHKNDGDYTPELLKIYEKLEI